MSEPAPAGDMPVHGMRWGIKTSFIEYVRRMPDGQVAVGDGAVPVGTHEVFFTLDPAVPPTPEAWAFRGDLRVTGHYGMPFVRLARPRILLEGSSGTLTIEDAEGGRRPLVAVTLEQFDQLPGAAIWTGSDVRLAASGVPLFNDVYPAGEPFEPLTLTLPVLDGTDLS